MAGFSACYFCIKAFSERDTTEDSKQFGVPTPADLPVRATSGSNRGKQQAAVELSETPQVNRTSLISIETNSTSKFGLWSGPRR